jgi:hypothetical protein
MTHTLRAVCWGALGSLLVPLLLLLPPPPLLLLPHA